MTHVQLILCVWCVSFEKFSAINVIHIALVILFFALVILFCQMLCSCNPFASMNLRVSSLIIARLDTYIMSVVDLGLSASDKDDYFRIGHFFAPKNNLFESYDSVLHPITIGDRCHDHGSYPRLSLRFLV